MNLDIITPLFGGARKRKRKYRYAVIAGRVRISRHYTKKAAFKACKGRRGCRVVPIGSRRRTSVRRRFSRRRRRY